MRNLRIDILTSVNTKLASISSDDYVAQFANILAGQIPSSTRETTTVPGRPPITTEEHTTTPIGEILPGLNPANILSNILGD